MFRTFLCIFGLWAFTTAFAQSSDLRYIQYDGFQLVVDCNQRSAVRFSYIAGPDTANLPRRSSFNQDPGLMSECQQFTGDTYSGAPEAFDRGHLVPANHLDNLNLGIYQSNYVTNILPQAKNMNRGAWLLTEEIIECHRESGELHVYGGPLFDKDESRDFFIKSHGVRTPSAFWKVIISEDSHIAWIIPNTSDAKRLRLDDYLVSIRKIEQVTGEKFQTISRDEKWVPANRSWAKTDGCNLS